jgi:hypothetical protein
MRICTFAFDHRIAIPKLADLNPQDHERWRDRRKWQMQGVAIFRAYLTVPVEFD